MVECETESTNQDPIVEQPPNWFSQYRNKSKIPNSQNLGNHRLMGWLHAREQESTNLIRGMRSNFQVSAIPSVPSGYSEAVINSNWKPIMDAEMAALHQNDTWVLVPPNPAQSILSCKWVFKKKFNEVGEVERFKARLIANEMRQPDGIDVEETFALVIKPPKVKIILSFPITWRWEGFYETTTKI